MNFPHQEIAFGREGTAEDIVGVTLQRPQALPRFSIPEFDHVVVGRAGYMVALLAPASI